MTPVPWEEVRRCVAVRPGTPDDLRLRARYERGQAEHGDDWTRWPPSRFEAEIQAEEDDIRIYRAMRLHVERLRRQEAGS